MRLKNIKNTEIFPVIFFVGVYLLARFIFGVHPWITYGFAFLLLLLRFSFEKIALSFFLICVMFYVFGKYTEANHYLSFVYGFIFLSLLKYIFVVLKERVNN